MMQDISMHVLDIGINAIQANSTEIIIKFEIDTLNDSIQFKVIDNGVGMDADELLEVQSPFYTSRKTRRFGLGIPFLKKACELSGGLFEIDSSKNHGTTIIAKFDMSNIDCPPCGNLAESIANLMVYNETINLEFDYIYNNHNFRVTTKEIKEEIEEILISEPTIHIWLKQYIREHIELIQRRNKHEIDC